ncbi:unnamed protein product [Bursaphelenchus okinawaensis]|uniref:Mediator of RNA polymerase II transcription subunit 27 n=1 Tax=Bursaphelenchus okinawaensis TaxID=465554 RepID=A0A811K9L9_9BILA|nr:unnamed protein product [Bursaphelenchus okinawaensis]CAG9097501.1 unnamed protein product [Bursaphelenchus okinawaensis]
MKPMQPQQPSQLDHRNLSEYWEKDRQTLGRLRSMVMKLNEFVEKSCTGSEVTVDEVKAKFTKLGERIDKEYESMETTAMKFAASSLDNHNQQMNRLNSFLMESLCDTGTKGMYERAQKFTTNMETTINYLNYSHEFMKNTAPPSLRPRRVDDRILHDISFKNQKAFEEAFDLCLQMNRRMCLLWLEKSQFGGLLEVKIRQTDRQNREYVCLQKLLFVVYNGSFEYVHIVAPFEDYVYQDESKKRVDLSKESKYEIYRRITHHSNITLSVIPSQIDMRNYIMHTMQHFSKSTQLDEPCCQCKKRLKDFQPVISETRFQKRAFHESCR